MATTTLVLIRALERLLRGDISEGSTPSAPLGALLDTIAASLRTMEAGETLAPVTLRRALRAAIFERNTTVLEGRPLDAMLLDAAVLVGEAIEPLALGDDQESRGYAGGALAPLAERWHGLGHAASPADALAMIKKALREQIERAARR